MASILGNSHRRRANQLARELEAMKEFQEQNAIISSALQSRSTSEAYANAIGIGEESSGSTANAGSITTQLAYSMQLASYVGRQTREQAYEAMKARDKAKTTGAAIQVAGMVAGMASGGFGTLVAAGFNAAAGAATAKPSATIKAATDLGEYSLYTGTSTPAVFNKVG